MTIKGIDESMNIGHKNRNDKTYLIMLVVFGCVFLTVNEGWNIYTEPVSKVTHKILSLLDHSEIPNESQTDGQSDGNPDADGNLSGNNGLPEDESSAFNNGEDVSGNIVGEPYAAVNYIDVEDDYFEDAVFVGDSRTVGLYEYGNLEEISDFYASTGLTVYKMFTDKIVEVPGQKKKITIEDAFAEQQFAKIYLMIGINEMGTGTAESFLEKYAECVDHIREMQPDAIIYLQSIMCVTEERSAQGDYITNEGIAVRNEGIAALADNETIFYLNVNECICDENGAMIPDYTYDGVHLKAQYISLWKDYLKSHVVEN